VRIITRRELRALPHQTLFSSYTPRVIDEVEIFCGGDDFPNDFVVQSISDAIECDGSDDFMDKLEAAEADPSISLPMDFDCAGRDGLFEDDTRLYAIWEKEDILKFIGRLTEIVASMDAAKEQVKK
jgi:hypothetical protein